MDCKRLSIYLTNEVFVTETDAIFKTLERDSIFNTGLNTSDYESLSINDFRKLQYKRVERLLEYGFTWLSKHYFNVVYVMATMDESIGMKRGINFGVCQSFSFFFFLLFCKICLKSC